jgi:predicted nucleotidyltransferase
VDYVTPLQALIPGVRGRVLSVLAETEAELTMRTVARLADVSVNRATEVLNELIELGIVLRRDVGRSALVAIDRENEAGGLILSLAMLRDRVVERLRDAAQAIEPAPASLTLFGSLARGTARVGSDVDVLAVAPASTGRDHEDEWVESLGRWAERATSIAGNPVNLIVVREEEIPQLLRREESFWTEILEGGILLAGRAVDAIPVSA